MTLTVLYDRKILTNKDNDSEFEKNVSSLSTISSEPTDLEIDSYINQCYKSGKKLLNQKCRDIEINNPMINIKIEEVDT